MNQNNSSSSKPVNVEERILDSLKVLHQYFNQKNQTTLENQNPEVSRAITQLELMGAQLQNNIDEVGVKSLNKNEIYAQINLNFLDFQFFHNPNSAFRMESLEFCEYVIDEIKILEDLTLKFAQNSCTDNLDTLLRLNCVFKNLIFSLSTLKNNIETHANNTLTTLQTKEIKNQGQLIQELIKECPLVNENEIKSNFKAPRPSFKKEFIREFIVGSDEAGGLTGGEHFTKGFFVGVASGTIYGALLGGFTFGPIGALVGAGIGFLTGGALGGITGGVVGGIKKIWKAFSSHLPSASDSNENLLVNEPIHPGNSLSIQTIPLNKISEEKGLSYSSQNSHVVIGKRIPIASSPTLNSTHLNASTAEGCEFISPQTKQVGIVDAKDCMHSSAKEKGKTRVVDLQNETLVNEPRYYANKL